jgi:hypothetical protein
MHNWRNMYAGRNEVIFFKSGEYWKYERESQHLLLCHTVTSLHMKISVDSVGELWDENCSAAHDSA